jgi:hypothetical protein
MSRSERLDGFLAAAGWSGADRTPLAGDASTRSYRRLRHPDGQSAILMVAPPERGTPTRPFVEVARLLTGWNLTAPQILAWDEDAGLLLLEDLGDDLLARLAAADPACEAALYEAAVDVLAALHRHPVPPGFPVYAHADMAGRAALAARWYLPGAEGRRDEAGAARLESEVARLLAEHAPGHTVVALRDYHAENLIWLPGRDGPRRIGLLDFQDAMAGHPAYDLVSLIEDARRDVDPALREPLVARYLCATGAEPEPFTRACAVLAAQRNLRIIGVFSRLCLHYGKPQYIALLPRVWRHLERDLSHPALEGLRALVADILPEPSPARLDRLRAEAGTWPMP